MGKAEYLSELRSERKPVGDAGYARYRMGVSGFIRVLDEAVFVKKR